MWTDSYLRPSLPVGVVEYALTTFLETAVFISLFTVLRFYQTIFERVNENNNRGD